MIFHLGTMGIDGYTVEADMFFDADDYFEIEYEGSARCATTLPIYGSPPHDQDTRTPELGLARTAAASHRVGGLRRIEFPCGYNVPAGAFAAPGQALEIAGPRSAGLGPSAGSPWKWRLAAKGLTSDEARSCGRRVTVPGSAFYHAALLDGWRRGPRRSRCGIGASRLFYGLLARSHACAWRSRAGGALQVPSPRRRRS